MKQEHRKPGAVTTRMNDVQPFTKYLGGEVRELVEPGFLRAPVEVMQPVLREMPEIGKSHA